MLLRREALLARERADASLISLSDDLADMLSLLRLCSAYIYGERRRRGGRERSDDFAPIGDSKINVCIICQVQEEVEVDVDVDADLPFGLEVRLGVVGG